jgi:protein-tyrosine phosphatase
MAEVAFRNEIATDQFLANRVQVTSAGTANWHVGSEMDPRARAALDAAGLTQAGTPATYADREYLNRHDLVVVMTREQVHEVAARATNPRTRVVMLRNLLEPGLDLDVPDPYYGDLQDFVDCLRLIRAAGRHLTLELRQQLGAGDP